jgi:hypothetical protein
MKQRWSVLSFAALLPALVAAQSSRTYECTNAGNVRRVEIAYATAADVPCEVRYHKVSEAPSAPQVLWQAATQSGYCEARAQEFVAKLQGWGWTCADSGTSQAAPAREGDDTAVLEAGESAGPNQ